MPEPITIFSLIVATLFGASFHVVIGGDVRRLALFLLAGWIGFVLGHVLGSIVGLSFLAIGALNTFSAALGSLIALVFTLLLTRRTQSRMSMEQW